MTTHELARELLKGEDVEAVIAGYEGGYDIIGRIGPVEMFVTDVNEEFWLGKMEKVGSRDQYGEPLPDNPIVSGRVIREEVRNAENI